MNRRLLTLLAALSAVTFLLLTAIFVGAATYTSGRAMEKVSAETHATYLNEIVYNYKNELVSGNFRFFRNQIASLMDHEVFAEYAILQNGRQVEASEHFAERATSKGFQRISIPVWFNEEKTVPWGSVELLVSEQPPGRVMQSLRGEFFIFLIAMFALSLCLSALYFYSWQRLNLGLGREIEAVFAGSSAPKRGLAALLWKPTLDKLRGLKANRDALANQNAEAEKQLVTAEITRQVAHDIRSPLATLNLVSGQLGDVEQELRSLIQHAVQRITDIAHDLTQRALAGQETSQGPELSMLSSLVDQVVSEKRVQHREKIGVRIEADLAESYGLFATLRAPDVKRALSNLIDNAVEALTENRGHVRVRLAKENGNAEITVIDDGRGIPAALLSSIGRQGFSGRPGGSGLGVYQAKNAALCSGGELRIRSAEGKGTEAVLSFARAQAPAWFPAFLVAGPTTQFITIDDDSAIHALWKDRLASHHLLQFTSLATFESWLASNGNKSAERIYLFDYEFRGEAENGLDVIDRLGLGAQSMLVTSRFEENRIQQGCLRLQVRLVPKGLASLLTLTAG